MTDKAKTTVQQDRQVLLSAPDVGAAERQALLRAFDSGWIAPAGPEIGAFEEELSAYAGARACAALSSGTAALHLALLAVGVRPGDEVVVQSATFAASAFAVVHAGAIPIFMDSNWGTWCLDPALMREFLQECADAGSLPAAVMPVDLYGSTADYGALVAACEEFGVPLVRDAAEALGSVSSTGGVGAVDVPSVVSFNGNKIITTSSGGALFADQETVDHARYLSTQARQPVMHYEHTEIGFNYRLSNLLAALGRAQLAQLEDKIERRSNIDAAYKSAFPSMQWCSSEHTPRPNCWLSVGLLPEGVDPVATCERLHEMGIQARPAWKPMHQQPVFAANEYIHGAGVADELFARGICLPTGSGMTDVEVEWVIEAVSATVPS